jgi:hypothetical protein
VSCWLARFSETPCDGQLVRVHLIPRQRMKKSWSEIRHRWPGTLDQLIADPRSWVLGCGGPTGVGGHHGELDYSRRLRIPLFALPTETVLLAEAIGLDWWLQREYDR